MPANASFGDKEMLTDALSTQKYITDTYNTWANECATPELRTDMMTLLSEEHQIQFDVFKEMEKRGWYAVTQADQAKMQQVKQKYMAQ